MRLRKYLNDALCDQLPVLRHMQRYVDELQVADAPEPTDLAARGL